MIKKIPIEQLAVGMYIHDLNCSWLDHSFLKSRFLVEDAYVLRKVQNTGVRELSIDTSRGIDVADAPDIEDEPDEVTIEEPLPEISGSAPFIMSISSHDEEVVYAKKLYANTNKLVKGMMNDIRLGKQVDVEQCEPMVEGIVDSIFRFPSALLPLAQVKTFDEYTFQHSAAVAALSVAFGRVLDLPRNEIKELAMGGLLHDVGKALLPGRLLNKPGKLSDEEFSAVKEHVNHGANLLKKTQGISEITFNAVVQHHERFDGSGYPNGLKGEQISLHGQMLAIVDVYDAITSLRVYHKGMPPAEALKNIFKWSSYHFNSTLVQAFIKGVGIYPAGSLVRIKSEKLGVVREVVPDKILYPVVLVIYDCEKKRYIKPEVVDLSAANDKIIAHESFETWGIKQAGWL